MVEVDGFGGDEFVEVLPLIKDRLVVGEGGGDGLVEECFKGFYKLFLIISLNHKNIDLNKHILRLCK